MSGLSGLSNHCRERSFLIWAAVGFLWLGIGVLQVSKRFPLPMLLQHGERVRVRGRILLLARACGCPSPRPSPCEERGEGVRRRYFFFASSAAKVPPSAARRS